ncbi:MAG: molybdopterin dinucleotide binding domain-containing protein, partial [Nocardioidaceae bacterium]
RLDASARGIEDGDDIEVFNDRGRLVLPSHVTTRIAPGVISVPQGAWYAPDEPGGLDRGGSMNTLTSQHPTSYSKANGQHSNLVEIKRV